MPRLLLVENHHAGDAVLALPFLRGARRGGADVAVCCTPAGAEIFRAAGVEHLIVLGGGDSLPASIARLRAFGPDVAASVWADSRMHVLMRLSGAKIRAGLPMNRTNFYGTHLPWRKRRLAQGRLLENLCRPLLGRLLTHEARRAGPMQSHLDDWRQVAVLAGVECDFSTPWIRPRGAGLDPALAGALSAARASGRLLLAVHHGGRLATKRWPAERFANVARRIAERGDVQLVAIKPPDCDALAAPSGAIRAVAKSIPELIELLSACDLLLCNDSLAGHLAASLGRKVVSVFGSGHPGWFAPFGSGAWAVKDDQCMYNPCLDRCLMGRTLCLENIAEAQVTASVERCIEAARSEVRDSNSETEAGRST